MWATGCGAAWLARWSGGPKVPGSNPGSPTEKPLRVADATPRATTTLGAWSRIGHGREQGSDLRGRVDVLVVAGMRVEVERDRHRRMPESFLHHLR